MKSRDFRLYAMRPRPAIRSRCLVRVRYSPCITATHFYLDASIVAENSSESRLPSFWNPKEDLSSKLSKTHAILEEDGSFGIGQHYSSFLTSDIQRSFIGDVDPPAISRSAFSYSSEGPSTEQIIAKSSYSSRGMSGALDSLPSAVFDDESLPALPEPPSSADDEPESELLSFLDTCSVSDDRLVKTHAILGEGDSFEAGEYL